MKSFSGLLALTFGLTVCACGHIRADSLPRSTTAEHTQAVAAAPRIIALPPPLVRVGDAFSYQIACDQANVAFSAMSLPTGLSVDVATGLITGSPQVAGSFAVTLGVANAHGSSSSPLTLFIRPALPTVSLVATQPLTTPGGEPAKIKVTRTGDLSAESDVTYSLSGDAINGRDYRLLSGLAIIGANRNSVLIKIVPVEGAEQTGTRKLKLTLQPDSTSYRLGGVATAKVKILPSGI